jgi:hypothetical protein
VTDTENQGDCYSLLPEAKRVQPDQDSGGEKKGPQGNETTVTNHGHVNLFREIDRGDRGFGDGHVRSNYGQNENDRGSSESRTAPDSVAMTDLEEQVWRNLKTGR